MPTFDALTFWQILQDAGIKSAVLLAAALLTTLALRKASASLRHLVWLLALGGAIPLPALSAPLPQWAVLPAWHTTSPSSQFPLPCRNNPRSGKT